MSRYIIPLVNVQRRHFNANFFSWRINCHTIVYRKFIEAIMGSSCKLFNLWWEKYAIRPFWYVVIYNASITIRYVKHIKIGNCGTFSAIISNRDIINRSVSPLAVKALVGWRTRYCFETHITSYSLYNYYNSSWIGK